MNPLSLDQILKIVNDTNNETHFLLPDDIFGHGSKHVAKFAAATIIKKYHHYWKMQNQETTFFVYAIENERVWVPSAQEWQHKNVVKISMTNDTLAEFAANMNTFND